MLRQAPTHQMRLAHKARQSFSLGAVFMIDLAKERFKGIVRSFLSETAETYELKQHFRGLYKRVEGIQSAFRGHQAALEQRCEALSDIWDRERAALIKECMAKKNKKKASLMKKLNLMQEDVKKAMIKAYLERCKLRY